MRSITVYFENEEFKELIIKKQGRTWRDYILELTGIERQ
jgi:hypothetical protein